MLLIDKLSYTSGLRRYSPGLKASLAFITLLICITSRCILVSLAVILMAALVTVKIGKIPWMTYFRLLALPAGFLFMGIIGILLNLSLREPDSGILSIKIGSVYILVMAESLLLAGRILASAFAALSCLYFLSLSTPLMEILMVFKKAGCPHIILELMLLTYRFLFILMNTGNHLTVSAHARLGNRSLRTSIHSMGYIFSSLLIHSMKRASALYDGMEARCYDGSLHLLAETPTAGKRQIAAVICFDLTLALLAFILW